MSGFRYFLRGLPVVINVIVVVVVVVVDDWGRWKTVLLQTVQI